MNRKAQSILGKHIQSYTRSQYYKHSQSYN